MPVHVTCTHDDVSDVCDVVGAEPDQAHCPVREVAIRSDNEDQVELAAILVPTTAEDAELDVVVAASDASPPVKSATWSVETTA